MACNYFEPHSDFFMGCVPHVGIVAVKPPTTVAVVPSRLLRRPTSLATIGLHLPPPVRPSSVSHSSASAGSADACPRLHRSSPSSIRVTTPFAPHRWDLRPCRWAAGARDLLLLSPRILMTHRLTGPDAPCCGCRGVLLH